MSSHVNGAGRLFGGQLMEWIDVVAAVAARRHTRSDVTLAAVDALEFIAPVHMNDTVLLSADVTWTGRTSLEVCVETFVEHLTGRRQLVNRAYLVFVAVDDAGKPRQIPPLTVTTAAQRQEWQQAEVRRAHRLGQRQFGQSKAPGETDA
ncbi:MAG: acyl-CoA thioesterase [Clostridiaceae bacterium]|jgi:acyl-CoA hydrolase|nr:acyl-CoA thioesterase [Clostridiaceae bacterium]